MFHNFNSWQSIHIHLHKVKLFRYCSACSDGPNVTLNISWTTDIETHSINDFQICSDLCPIWSQIHIVALLAVLAHRGTKSETYGVTRNQRLNQSPYLPEHTSTQSLRMLSGSNPNVQLKDTCMPPPANTRSNWESHAWSPYITIKCNLLSLVVSLKCWNILKHAVHCSGKETTVTYS